MKTFIVLCIIFGTILTNNAGAMPKMIVRSEWKAIFSMNETVIISKTPSVVVIYHTSTAKCRTTDSCKAIVKQIQIYDIFTEKWNDIGCHFLIGDDGNIYEGRGWNVLGEHSETSDTIDVCIIGTFSVTNPSKATITALENFLEYCRMSNKIEPDYGVHVRRFLTPHSQPADKLRNFIRAWPRWRAYVNVIDRTMWKAKKSKMGNVIMSKTPSSVIVYQTSTRGCIIKNICRSLVQDIQNSHMNVNNWNDIGCNFLIGEDGNVYEGRGWNVAGAHSDPHNSRNIEICFMGNYIDNKPLSIAVDAMANLIEFGVAIGKLLPGYGLYEYRWATRTFNPPKKLSEIVEKSPHWKPSPIIMSRDIWGAGSIDNKKKKFPKIPDTVMIFQSMTQSCMVVHNCRAAVKNIQNHHVGINKWSNIGYNFLIGEDGNVYEGRGWDVIGQHVDDNDAGNIKICLIGNFTEHEPDSIALRALRQLLSFGIALGKINSKYNLSVYEMRTSYTIGKSKLYKSIRKWPHWHAHSSSSIVKRSEWGAKNVAPKFYKFNGVPSSVVIYQLKTPSCTTFDRCREILKEIEINSKENYVPYNFFIDQNGNVYEGAGWDAISAHATSYLYRRIFDSNTLEICLFGNFEYGELDSASTDAIIELLELGVTISKLLPKYTVYQSVDRDSRLFNMIAERMSRWPHWRECPNIITRDEWGAKFEQCKWTLDYMQFKTRIIIYQIATPHCATLTDCMQTIKNIQEQEMRENRCKGISYNFLIDGNGNVYEGRGWHVELEEISEYDNASLAIGFIGKFDDKKSDSIFLDAMEKLLDCGKAFGYVYKGYKLYGVRHPMLIPDSIDLYKSVKKLPQSDAHPNIIMRSAWNARHSMEPGKIHADIATVVLISHVSSSNCITLEGCAAAVKEIQNRQMDRENLTDIGYNFLIGKDGNVYEGRGWNVLRSHSSNYQAIIIGICIMGNYEDINSKSTAIEALENLLQYGIAMNKLSQEYNICRSGDIDSNSGMKLFEFIKSMPHWREYPRILERASWNATSPKKLEINYSENVIVSYTETDKCVTHYECAVAVKNIQTLHMNVLNLTDIGCNFLIGNDANVYEGRGWNIPGPFVSELQLNTIKICIIGHFNDYEPNSVPMDTLNGLLKYGSMMKLIPSSYVLYNAKKESVQNK